MIEGDRIKVSAHTDLFMRGERFARVERVGRTGNMTVRGERSGKLFYLPPDGGERVDDNGEPC